MAGRRNRPLSAGFAMMAKINCQTGYMPTWPRSRSRFADHGWPWTSRMHFSDAVLNFSTRLGVV
jgi:hypothetical protein